MKINEKDVTAGLLLILMAAAGLAWNGSGLAGHVGEHALGSARRMGPGYMPMLVFWLQFGLGAAVLGIGLFNGPDPLEKWTGLDWISLAAAIVGGSVVWQISPLFGEFFTNGYNGLGLGMLVGFFIICWAQGWRLMGYILAAMCAFGLLLEKGGLVAATVGTVVISAMADENHRRKPLGVAGVTIFLVALCWWVFIKQLDIRVAVWPQF